MLIDDETLVEQWLIDAKGYIDVDVSNILEAPVDEAFLQSFASIESLFPTDAFAKNEIQGIRCSYLYDFEEIVIEFDYVGQAGMVSHYRYALPQDGSYIDITVTDVVNGIDQDAYSIFFIDDPDIVIELPER